MQPQSIKMLDMSSLHNVTWLYDGQVGFRQSAGCMQVEATFYPRIGIPLPSHHIPLNETPSDNTGHQGFYLLEKQITSPVE